MADSPVPYPLAKRLTDKVVPLTAGVLLSPVLAAVLIAMALDMLLVPADRGPLFYRERRVSHGREIGILKFRVLRRAVLEQMREEGGEHVRLYERRAENLTWAGRRLLKPFYLDEIPQIVNIVRGEMSLVGPRPWPVAMVEEQTARGLTYRNAVRAGWTGLAQLNKTSATGTLSRAEELDLEYLDACRSLSPWRLWRYDWHILFRTMRMLLRGEGLTD
jgi:lipopolysaccharide/colanic/teichoic acid biosynthesis glycosyltransferase